MPGIYWAFNNLNFPFSPTFLLSLTQSTNMLAYTHTTSITTTAVIMKMTAVYMGSQHV